MSFLCWHQSFFCFMYSITPYLMNPWVTVKYFKLILLFFPYSFYPVNSALFQLMNLLAFPIFLKVNKRLEMLQYELMIIFVLLQAFVESNKSIKWCPVAGCGRAVRLPEIEQMHCTTQAKTSHAVDCGNGHFFCW